MSGLPVKSRLGVVEHVYHQSSNDQPMQVEGRFSRPLLSNEQPFRRKLTATQERKRLETAWIDDAGMLCLANEEGKCEQVVPTPEQRALNAAKVVELSYGDSDDKWLILPGETFRGQPSNVKNLFVRCQCGTAECWVTIFPK
jgi:hypothetical protein